MNKLWFVIMIPWLAALPSSSSYQLNSYGFGSGGGGDLNSSNYRLNGSVGEVAGSSASSNYKAGSGENYLKQANVPIVTLSNPSQWYNKLQLDIDPQNNPSDAKFAIAISTDNFTTTRYVKSDFTVGLTLTPSDYLTYSGWGGGSGVIVRGLRPNTLYTAKGKAIRGAFTESGYGPASSATLTDVPQLTFDIDVSATNTSTNPPYAINFGNLPVSTVTDSPTRVWVSFETNAESGGNVYISSQNTGLKSTGANYTIGSVTGDLASLSEGFGAQGASATQSSGGPFSLVSPYNGSGGNVGPADTTIREIFSAGGPTTSGRGSFILKAKTQPLTPASGDYTEIITAIASASF